MADHTLIDDPSLKMPPAIKAAADRANAAFYAANGTTPPGEPPVDPAPPADPVPPVEPVTPQVTPDDNSWEHKYKSLKGRFERAQSDMRNMSEQIALLQANSNRSTAAPPPLDATPAERFVTPEEEADYGAEFLSVVGKRAKQEVHPLISSLENEIKTLKSRLDGVNSHVSQDARTRLEDTLSEHIPDWREINIKPEFHEWLALPDTYSGVIRMELLKKAYERNDSPRTLAFFRGFLAEEAALAPATSVRPDQNTAVNAGKIPLETFAAPGRATTPAPASGPVEKPFFTRSEITKFYTDSAAGRYAGREADYNLREAQINAAVREGRIR